MFSSSFSSPLLFSVHSFPRLLPFPVHPLKMFIPRLFSLSALCLIAAPLVTAYSDPGTCSGACWAHDPSVIQRTSDGLYFKFNTGGGIEISTATSLSGPWTRKGVALSSGSSIDIDGNTDLWVSTLYFNKLFPRSEFIGYISFHLS